MCYPSRLKILIYSASVMLSMNFDFFENKNLSKYLLLPSTTKLYGLHYPYPLAKAGKQICLNVNLKKTVDRKIGVYALSGNRTHVS